jgi:hypothetical protein
MYCIFETALTHRLGLKQISLFSFSRKTKISENSLTFRKILYRENFLFLRKNFVSQSVLHKIFRESFHEKFLFPKLFLQKFSQNISRKILIFTQSFHFCSYFRSGYTFSWLLDPDPHSEWKFFTKTFAKQKI